MFSKNLRTKIILNLKHKINIYDKYILIQTIHTNIFRKYLKYYKYKYLFNNNFSQSVFENVFKNV